jgi:hypothetical protein
MLVQSITSVGRSCSTGHWAEPDFPKSGWYYVHPRIDYQEKWRTCDMCLIEDVHKIIHFVQHAEHDTMLVGCVCAGNMTGNLEHSRRIEADYKNFLKREETRIRREERDAKEAAELAERKAKEAVERAEREAKEAIERAARVAAKEAERKNQRREWVGRGWKDDTPSTRLLHVAPGHYVKVTRLPPQVAGEGALMVREHIGQMTGEHTVTKANQMEWYKKGTNIYRLLGELAIELGKVL